MWGYIDGGAGMALILHSGLLATDHDNKPFHHCNLKEDLKGHSGH